MPPRANLKEFHRVHEDPEKRQEGSAPENEIRVTARHGQHSYITYAIAVLNGEDGKTKNDTIKISGMGGAIFNAVNIAEIVKRRVVGLHQITEIASESVRDEYEPHDRERNPENLVVERKVSTILITLSRQQLDKTNPGYQEPLPEDQVTEQEKREPGETHTHREGRGGRGSRGGRGTRGARGGPRGGRGRGGN
ncbi:hypothetical protein STCU_01060 [Strigomonas culicis]|uniref:DNA/RNA-binding protein Alba-like domain-containing protein n=1 Tax=Strigomonas culicis TaxID=28005 RepID=S9V3N8_9TRYP|nr:hypothetical protein STCU_01060 [Strigomonas culicis]|eukprot:EPY35614.1 hypothetical protein STCU_01060 [Strigomonas culicis]